MSKTIKRTVRVDGDDPWFQWTQEAADSLVGQRPVLTVAFDRTNVVGRATVTGARLDDTGGLVIDMDLLIRDDGEPVINELLGKDDPSPVSIGFKPDGPFQTRDGGRTLGRINLHEMGPPSMKPSLPHRKDT